MQHNHMLSHFWSLSVEEQFYLIWPGVLPLLLRFKASKALMISLLGLGILAPAIARAWLWHDGPSLRLYFRSDLRVDALIWGAALAWLVHNGMLSSWHRVQQFAGLAGVVALCLFLYISQFDLLSDGEAYRWAFSLADMLSVTMIWGATVASSEIFSKCLRMRWLRYTGRISYGLYLWHVPVFTLCNQLPLTESHVFYRTPAGLPDCRRVV